MVDEAGLRMDEAQKTEHRPWPMEEGCPETPNKRASGRAHT